MNVYLNFPEEFDEDKSIINTFSKILFLTKNKTTKIFYSIENLNSFKKLNEGVDIYLVNEVKIIRQFLSSSRAIPVKKTDPKIQYLQWSLTDFKANYCGELLSNIAENKYSNNNYHFILINLSESITPCRGKILVFRDSYQNDFPDYFVKIDYLENEIEFDEWLKTNNTKGFNLRNNPAFQKMSSIAVKGAIVYLELKTQRYWHLDTFHDYKEYEVYDSTGKHLATADENGKLNFDGIVLDRFINIK